MCTLHTVLDNNIAVCANTTVHLNSQIDINILDVEGVVLYILSAKAHVHFDLNTLTEVLMSYYSKSIYTRLPH